MYQRSLKKVFYIPKLVLLTTQAQKCGKTTPTITKVIFGLWVVFFMNQLLLSLLSELKICKACIRKFSKESTPKYQMCLALT